MTSKTPRKTNQLDEVSYKPTSIDIRGSHKMQMQKIRKTLTAEDHGNKVRPGYIQKFNPKRYVTKDIKQRDVVQIKAVFDSLDSTKSGLLNPGDVSRVLNRYGFKGTKETVYSIVAQYDAAQQGGIHFNQFIKMLSDKPVQKQNKLMIKRVFKKIDKAGKGYIDLNDLRSLNKQLHEGMQDEVLYEILKKSDPDKDGHIQFQDFYNIMVSMKYYM